MFLTLHDDCATAIGVKQTTLHKTIALAADFIKSARPLIRRRQAEIKSQINSVYNTAIQKLIFEV